MRPDRSRSLARDRTAPTKSKEVLVASDFRSKAAGLGWALALTIAALAPTSRAAGLAASEPAVGLMAAAVATPSAAPAPVAGTVQSSTPLGVPAPAEAYAQAPRLGQVTLSPSGRRIAALVNQGDDSLLVVREVDGDEAFTPVLKSDNDDFRFRWIAWANDERLLASVAFATRRGFVGSLETRLLSIGADGRGLVNLVRNQGFAQGHWPAQFQDRIVDMLPDDDRHVLLQMPAEGTVNPAVYQVDVVTAQRRLVHPPQRDVRSWMTDARHRVRVGLRQRDDDVTVLVSDVEGTGWRETWRFKVLSDEAVWPLGFGSDPDRLYVRARHEGRWAVFEADLRPSPPVLSLKLADPGQDLDGGLERLGREGAVVGVRSSGDDLDRIEPWEPSLRALSQALDKVLPDRLNRITGFSEDGQRYVLHSEGNGAPARYYLGERRTHELVLLGGTHPTLDGVPLVGKTPFAFRRRDGRSAQAMLSAPAAPPGSPASSASGGRRLPLVLMPQGGELGRHGTLFDPWTEFLASRGYAVLQVPAPVRSDRSPSSGDTGLLASAQAMQDDLADALAAAVSTGLADPRRVCIVGAGAGGQAALMAAIAAPGAYRCAASVAGITDLIDLWHHQTNFVNGRAMADLFIGNAWRDRDRLRAESPALQAARVEVPVLLVHGTADRDVPLDQSERMDKALRGAGKPVRYVKLDGADHAFSRSSDRLLVYQELERFLAPHLGGTTAVAESR